MPKSFLAKHSRHCTNDLQFLTDHNHIVVRPHADDEVIGCFELYNMGLPVHTIRIGTPTKRDDETCAFLTYCDKVHTVRDDVGYANRLHTFKYTEFWDRIEEEFDSHDDIVWFPCPMDVNPTHRIIAALAQQCKHVHTTRGYYSTQMDNPLFVRECLFPEEKRDTLDMFYKSQRCLWKYEYKYWLYEGRTILA